MAYGVVRTDKMAGTDVRSLIVSMKYMGANGAKETAIENGNVLKVGALKSGEREIYIGENVKADDALSDIALVASVEVMYDERKSNLDEFINEAGAVIRGYKLHSGDIFSVTADAITTKITPAKGNIVELAAGTKLSVVESATPGSTVVGKIDDIESIGRYTFYVIKVK